MQKRSIGKWRHDHTFGQDRKRAGERRTLIVIVITAVMMVAEIAAGILFGSMALLADGLHMASHAAALTIAVIAYIFARRRANDPRYSFGTGKVNALGGFTGAVLLSLFALLMVSESFDRFLHPVEILFNRAILVAILGLVVNGVSAVILGGGEHSHEHEHGSDHAHSHTDHNLRAAYFHVLADALTSILAIVALLAGKHMGFVWMDPLMGVIGAILVARWSWGLMRDAGRVLLDRQAPDETLAKIREAIESGGSDRVADLHVWSIGPGLLAASLTIVSDQPEPPDHYKALLQEAAGLAHTTVEVHRWSDS